MRKRDAAEVRLLTIKKTTYLVPAALDRSGKQGFFNFKNLLDQKSPELLGHHCNDHFRFSQNK